MTYRLLIQDEKWGKVEECEKITELVLVNTSLNKTKQFDYVVQLDLFMTDCGGLRDLSCMVKHLPQLTRFHLRTQECSHVQSSCTLLLLQNLACLRWSKLEALHLTFENGGGIGSGPYIPLYVSDWLALCAYMPETLEEFYYQGCVGQVTDLTEKLPRSIKRLALLYDSGRWLTQIELQKLAHLTEFIMRPPGEPTLSLWINFFYAALQVQPQWQVARFMDTNGILDRAQTGPANGMRMACKERQQQLSALVERNQYMHVQRIRRLLQSRISTHSLADSFATIWKNMILPLYGIACKRKKS